MSGKVRVTINVAQSLNGLIAGKFGRRVQISSAEDWDRVLDLRMVRPPLIFCDD